MAKDKSEKKERKDKSDKKEKKEKKEKHSSRNGVSKKDTKEKKHLTIPDPDNADALLQDISAKEDNVAIKPEPAPAKNGDIKVDVEMGGAGEDEKEEKLVLEVKPKGALVPFANPLADEKASKKVFKSVKKASKAKSLKRGVKEVVKTLRKSPLATNASLSPDTIPLGIVVIAADISPMDVISHLPVLCEDHAVPYIYVTSRAELGAAGGTKRPTSVVLVAKEAGKRREKKGEEGEGEGEEKKVEEWGDVYKDLVKVVRRAGRDVRI